MTINTTAHNSEQPFNLESIHYAFAQACYCYGRVVNNAHAPTTPQDTKLKLLAYAAIDLATAIQELNNGDWQ